ncbi:dihydroorotate dehydrogenase electron transfer subunit [Falsibacillus pallidus]|uniref:Dihydroorotate dehydrogenase B (NAD(+)), electron transfer subunit n=1 Tax=Falsibacillus pallidus TaxID=493781 RepID=A0A370GVG0_9BACI|nr:dihydroorotate dehydrogenase electron transfer subunit [Falsibacillus pallidus]RDI47521.1 dihydroorotate oxidase B electron transfer subunit [Falsibacillus pallidus]
MIRKEKMTVVSQKMIAENIYEMILHGELVSEMDNPGQFVHVKAEEGIDPLLRRPISISSIDKKNNAFTMIYRTEGKGTKRLAQKNEGDSVDVLGPLGNGFPILPHHKGKRALLVGGGIGVPPLYELSKRLVENKMEVVHVLGFQTESSSFYMEEFASLGHAYAATVDGSLGTKGFVTSIIDDMDGEFDVLYACGPIPMLRALEQRFSDIEAYLSLEQRMGCGIGACFACVCPVQGDESGTEYRKVCSDGPVFPVGEVVL